ncbi:MarR family transcriptional regulator [Saccharopolyspora aridisoli]|uniref:MarR family transcriptional regulator n=1 Tax=Saccharopolyspora aridisoli TaxID=2530385 RepID=A0A4R4UMB5_9PSEU|nr:MarR family transcriptional regulator [Saccharopolyspora aridisoli]TDC92840.1 MarR family transcriptional regulator [Saccharopolyspora aridisoli]
MREPDPLSTESLDDLEAAIGVLMVVWGRSAERIKPKVSPSQLRALVVVDRHGSTTLMSLADELGSIPSVTSRVCDRLQAAGLLDRAASADDRREVVLQLSRDGRRLLRQFQRERQTDLKQVLNAMPPRSRTALLTGLSAFYAAATELDLPDAELA